jgi:hypothetical protein
MRSRRGRRDRFRRKDAVRFGRGHRFRRRCYDAARRFTVIRLVSRQRGGHCD